MDLCTYPITVEREGRKYHAYSEDFAGAYGLGKRIEETTTSILEAMKIYLQEFRAEGDPICFGTKLTVPALALPRGAGRFRYTR
jgi:predicted RNase H-like HicB family nuclease